MTRTQILNEAIIAYGDDNQVDVAIEEMSELTKALIKLRRAERLDYNDPFRDAEIEMGIDDIRDEIADVQIMLDQLRIIYGFTDQQEKFKLERLRQRLEGEING